MQEIILCGTTGTNWGTTLLDFVANEKNYRFELDNYSYRKFQNMQGLMRKKKLDPDKKLFAYCRKYNIYLKGM